jgi:cytidylate kinase
MAIITITDGVFGCGEALAKRVSALLGYRYVGQRELINAVQLNWLPEAIPSNILDVEPPLLKRLLENPRYYRIALQTAMCDVAERGNFVYHGSAGQELIPTIRHVLKVLLIVPIEYRAEHLRQAKGLAKKAAQLWAAKSDSATNQRMKAIFGVGWRDLDRYDLALNISTMDLESAACLIVKMVEQGEYQATGESEIMLGNFVLETKVRAALLASRKTRSIDLQVQADSGNVNLSGLVDPIKFDFKDEIIRVAEAVLGVRKVTVDIRLVLPANDDSFAAIQVDLPALQTPIWRFGSSSKNATVSRKIKT